MDRTKFYLEEKDMPQAWYNVLPDLPEPLPAVLHPATGNPVTPGRVTGAGRTKRARTRR